MNHVSKFVAVAALGIGTMLTSPAAPTQAQTRPPVCCIPTTVPVVTNALWTVMPPPPYAGSPIGVTIINPPVPGWAAALPGSQWISNALNPSHGNEPVGDYTYRLHFCLCAGPSKVPFPATMALNILADNSFKAYLNWNPIGQYTGPPTWGFHLPATALSAPAAAFQPGDNELEIVVNNLGGPTGLDVAGTLSGFFQQVRPGERCPRVRPQHNDPTA